LKITLRQAAGNALAIAGQKPNLVFFLLKGFGAPPGSKTEMGVGAVRRKARI
jgi:hypothetical protein